MSRCLVHHGPKRVPLELRILPRINKNTDSGCWQWTGSLTTTGYALVPIQGSTKTAVLVHRWMYERDIGPIPYGLQLDHLCRNAGCVNPAHLEPVTAKENNRRSLSPSAQNARKTHCIKGHPFDETNMVHITSCRGVERKCRVCARDRCRRYRNRMRLQRMCRAASGATR